MEILLGIVIIGMALWLSRVWAGRSAQAQDEDDLPRVVPSPLYGNNSNAVIFDPTVSSTNLSTNDASPDDFTSYTADTTGSGSDPGVQDCSPDSGTDTSAGDCACPADSTSYDSGGCSVDSSPADSGSFDSGSTN